MKQQSKHIHRYHHHSSFSYPASLAQKIYSILLGPLVIVIGMYMLTRIFSFAYPTTTISFGTLALATSATFARLFIAYVISVVVAVPLAIFITWKPSLETIFLPIFDILESIPILAFFPVVILIFFRFNFLNGAAIFIIFLGMVWNILFTVVGGLKVIPRDIIDAAHVFKINGFSYFTKVLLPAIVPELVTGSILAVAQGWNIIIVAEVMHVYLPGGTASSDLFGIGSVLVHASGSGQTMVFMTAIGMMVLTIAAFNFLVWQKLLHYAQRYRFE
jgi:NitT/TauT family transport system permease protein